MQNYKICPHCGEVLRPGALVCTYCKQKVNKDGNLIDIFDVRKQEKTSAQKQQSKVRKPKKNNAQTKGYGKQWTAAPKPIPTAGSSSKKKDARSKKQKKWIIILVILLMILSEIPWSTLGQQFYRLRFMIEQQAERMMEQTGIMNPEDTNGTTSDGRENTAADNTLVLKPSSNLDDYQMSSIRISAPKGYTIYLSGNNDSFLYADPDSDADTKLIGNFNLEPTSWEDQMTSDFDYLNEFDEYQNVTITEKQQCKTKAGTVSYIVATYSYGEDGTDTTECTCWLEYDENTLLVYRGLMNTIDDNLTDQIKTLFSTIKSPK